MQRHTMTIADATVIIETKDGFPKTRYRQGTARPPTARPPEELRAAVRLIEDFIARRTIDRSAIARLLPDSPPFHAACWRAALTIPAGETRTYGWLAAAAGRPKAPRAAAAAMARNPLAPLVPCHRVVSASGLGGFCGAMERTSAAAPKHWALLMKLRMIQLESEDSYTRPASKHNSRKKALHR